MEKVENKTGLWENKDKNGNSYWSGTHNGFRYAVFPNQYYVEGSGKPKYNMMITPVEAKPKAEPKQDDLPF